MSTTRPPSDPTPVTPVTPPDVAPPVTTPGDASSAPQVEREFTVRAMTSRQLILRRFLRHRAALAGLAVFLTTVFLAFTSIGFGPLPGWWNLDYESPATVVNAGRMSLD